MTSKLMCPDCPYEILSDSGFPLCGWESKAPGDIPPCEDEDYPYDEDVYEDYYPELEYDYYDFYERD